MDVLLTVQRSDGSVQMRRVIVETVDQGVEVVKEAFFEDGTLEVSDYKIIVVMQEGRWPDRPVDVSADAPSGEVGTVWAKAPQGEMVLSHEMAQALLALPNVPLGIDPRPGLFRVQIEKDIPLTSRILAERIARNEDEGSYIKRIRLELARMEPTDCAIISGGQTE